MRIKRSTGLTPSEELLAKLCDRSFLSLWSYPNLFRRPGKELCDLLVVFGDDVVIFSDKSCAYPNTGDTVLDWKRWYRRSIAESAKQLRRVEGWLKNSPERVFLDAKCREPLPINLPPAERLRVYRVCVAVGASARTLTESNKRDLTISAIVEDDNERFTIGKITAAPGFVHVFDENTLPVVLSELSTIADFLDYLRKKEFLLESGRFAFGESELDLLGYFLWHDRKFPFQAETRFRLDPNLWRQVEADTHFLAAREENKVAHFWDGMIEYLTELYMKEELERGNEMAVADYERTVRLMAAETRFSRRLLSKWILERAELAKDGYVGSYSPSLQEGVLYVLLVGTGDGGKDNAEYRKARSEQLFTRCIASKAAEPDKRFIIGIALDARGVKGSTEDFIYMDTDGWAEEEFRKADEVRQELGYFIEGNARQSQISEAEYPGT